MSINTRKKQRIEKLTATIQIEATAKNKDALEYAKKKANECTRRFTLASIIGPIVLAVFYAFLPVDLKNLLSWRTLIDTIGAGVLIAVILVLFANSNNMQDVVVGLQTSKEQMQKQIEGLEKNIKLLKTDKTFYISATELIGKAINDGSNDLKSLAKVVISAIYHDLSKIADGDNLTINLYELKNGKIKMLHSSTRLHHCDKNSINLPELYKEEAGLDIKDNHIEDYYCIKCIRGKVRDRGNKYILSDWISIVEKFKWHWKESEKEDILKSRDRNKCIELGFKYNQYFAFKMSMQNNITGYFEIIANEDTFIALDEDLVHVGQRLQEKYSPLLSVLWDISGASCERNEI